MSSDEADLTAMVDDLSTTISDLEKSLQPLLSQPISTASSKLPLLDKAKLYVLATYAIESILFSALRLNGTDAKEHGVFKELTRVKEYFAKVKAAEGGGPKRGMVVDKDAAGRMIKHTIGGEARKRKADKVTVGTHTRFDGAAKRMRVAEDGSTRVLDADISGREGKAKHKRFEDEDESEDEATVALTTSKERGSRPKRTHEAIHGQVDSSTGESAKAKKKKKGKKKNKGQKSEDEGADETR